MLFNSIPYLILFFFTYILYWNISQKGRKPLLILSSLVFYAYFSFPFLFHFLAVILVNYLFSEWIFKRKNQGKSNDKLLAFVVLLNLINLGFFKYFYFVTGTLYSVFGWQEVKSFATSLNIFLPLAISFYTFQVIALQVDIHRGILKEKVKFEDYFLFILFFPQLIAGPIMRSDNFIPQIDHPEIDADRMKKGIFLILGGLFKKVVIAENIAPIISPLYLDPSKFDSFSLFFATMAFGMQIYCDFSGYTDLARGSANLLGYEIPENFQGPFLSQSYREIWSRWHITLSSWLRDYLYIPLGGSKGSVFRSNVNMFITMCLGGLWHGANWAFVAWGAYLGAFLWIERSIYLARGKKRLLPDTFPFVGFIRFLFVYLTFSFSGIFFRSAAKGDESMSTAYQIFKGILTFKDVGETLDRVGELPVFIALGLFFNWLQYSDLAYTKLKKYQNVLLPIFTLAIFLLLGIFGDGGQDFIYFQF
ncbi:MBOAT family protein [Leptospira ognonensis]|uniref:MBOAT family protein n=1 Tax=Leptospira ognonensis TaxID=2484945 RepID=A0A4R9JXR0_9LEPT|nr:MBOAT family O-acyltransferase [Leptospira ognonensis]TGL57990.1 MBOAT family protein [Leptospira ognonensis]